MAHRRPVGVQSPRRAPELRTAPGPAALPASARRAVSWAGPTVRQRIQLTHSGQLIVRQRVRRSGARIDGQRVRQSGPYCRTASQTVGARIVRQRVRQSGPYCRTATQTVGSRIVRQRARLGGPYCRTASETVGARIVGQRVIIGRRLGRDHCTVVSLPHWIVYRILVVGI